MLEVIIYKNPKGIIWISRKKFGHGPDIFQRSDSKVSKGLKIEKKDIGFLLMMKPRQKTSSFKVLVDLRSDEPEAKKFLRIGTAKEQDIFIADRLVLP